MTWERFLIALLSVCLIGTAYLRLGAGDKPSEPKITIATDPPTGCEYLIYGTTMTPRLLPNGDQVCGKGEGK
jgi:hypothetical protein